MKKNRQQEVYSLIGSECKTIMTRRKPLTKHMLTVDIIRHILLGVTSDHLSHQEVAIKFNVRPMLVHRLLKAHKKSSNFMKLLS